MRTRISVVVPVFQGAHHLPSLISEVAALRSRLSANGGLLELSELILVDDSSSDGSSEVMSDAAADQPWIHMVTLSKNFGQHPATMAGLLHSSGDWVVTMDEDLQHHPRHIVELLRAGVAKHADVVYAKPAGSVHGVAHRDLASRMYKWALARVAANPVISEFNSFRVCRGPIARAAAGVSGHETYLDVALTWFTDRFALHEVEMVDERFREEGRSGYSLRKLLSHARRLLVSSHARAMRFAALLGSLAVVVSLFFASRSILSRLTGGAASEVPGWTSLFVSILLFGGIISFLLVVVSEYLINIVLQAQGKPTFFSVDRSLDNHTIRAIEALDATI